MSEGIPAANMRRERREMMIYASRPVAAREWAPRKCDMRVKIVGAMFMNISLSRFATRPLNNHFYLTVVSCGSDIVIQPSLARV